MRNVNTSAPETTFGTVDGFILTMRNVNWKSGNLKDTQVEVLY